jgi:hypothetical protein
MIYINSELVIMLGEDRCHINRGQYSEEVGSAI